MSLDPPAGAAVPLGDDRTLARRVVEIDTTTTLERVLRSATLMTGWRLRHLDLRPYGAALCALDPAGALVLGCTLDPELAAHLDAGGALVYPDAPEAPVDEYRAGVYTPDELYAGISTEGYASTPDAKLYAWSHALGAHGLVDGESNTAGVVARALHDASIDVALTSAIATLGRPVVGVMGGHAVARGTHDYRRAADLGYAMSAGGCAVATGGGPGAMEAANLGAYLSPYGLDAVAAACAELAAVPSFQPSIDEWVVRAFAVRSRWPDGGASLGVPTWFYGHEPPNAFASLIAKFFQNAVREATLIERCNGGIVFLPGAAGTVQEIFQDACENYYAGDALAAPMVLVGVEHWTETLPVAPLLRALAARGGFADSVVVVDDVDEAVAVVTASTRQGTLDGTVGDAGRGRT